MRIGSTHHFVILGNDHIDQLVGHHYSNLRKVIFKLVILSDLDGFFFSTASSSISNFTLASNKNAPELNDCQYPAITAKIIALLMLTFNQWKVQQYGMIVQHCLRILPLTK